jgi:hypothetical protein
LGLAGGHGLFDGYRPLVTHRLSTHSRVARDRIAPGVNAMTSGA